MEKRQQEAPEVVSFEHFPAESSPDITNDDSASSTPVTEDRNHAIAVAVATAAAAEAAVAAAQAAAKVVRLAGYGRQSREDKAATLIQAHYRGYLVISLSLPLPTQTQKLHHLFLYWLKCRTINSYHPNLVTFFRRKIAQPQKFLSHLCIG